MIELANDINRLVGRLVELGVNLKDCVIAAHPRFAGGLAIHALSKALVEMDRRTRLCAD